MTEFTCCILYIYIYIYTYIYRYYIETESGASIGESMLDQRTRFYVGDSAQIVLVVEPCAAFAMWFP